MSNMRAFGILEEGRAVAVAAAATGAVLLREKVPYLASFYGRADSGNASRGWVSGALSLPVAAFMLQDQEAHAAEMERSFIAIKPDGVQRGLGGLYSKLVCVMVNTMGDENSCIKPLGRCSVFYYGVGHMLNDITSACWFTYLLVFLTDIGLPPRDAAAVMLSSQIADGFTTVFAGELVGINL